MSLFVSIFLFFQGLPEDKFRNMPRSKTIDKSHVFVTTLVNGLDFNSTDDLPVDIVFLLIAPENKGSENLQALALISRLLRNKELTTKLRGCKSAESAKAVISQSIRVEAA